MKHQPARKLYRGFHGQVTLECPTCKIWPHHAEAHMEQRTDAEGHKKLSAMAKCDDPRCGPWFPVHWESRVLAIDWQGPLFEEPMCPQCNRFGHKATITSEDTGGLLTDAEIAEIGQARIHTLLFVTTQCFDPDDMVPEKQLYPSLSAEFVAKHTLQRELDVVAHFMDLAYLGWLDVSAAGNCHKFAFGPKWTVIWERQKKETPA